MVTRCCARCPRRVSAPPELLIYSGMHESLVPGLWVCAGGSCDLRGRKNVDESATDCEGRAFRHKGAARFKDWRELARDAFAGFSVAYLARRDAVWRAVQVLTSAPSQDCAEVPSSSRRA